MYQLKVDLPPAWRRVDAEEMQGDGPDRRSGAITPVDVLRAAVADAGKVPAFAATVVFPLEEVAADVTSVLVASLVVEVLPTGGDRPVTGYTLLDRQIIDDYPVVEGVRCPVYLASYAVPSDDGGAVAVATFSSPNIGRSEEFDEGFASIVDAMELTAQGVGVTEVGVS